MITIYLSYDSIKKWFQVHKSELNQEWLISNIGCGSFWSYSTVQVFNERGKLVLNEKITPELHLKHYYSFDYIYKHIKKHLK